MSALADRLRRVADNSTLILTHHGRKTGRAFEVIIWFAVDGETIYLGTANMHRQWTRNVQKRSDVAVRIGDENFRGKVELLSDSAQREHAMELIKGKYLLGRVMYWLGGFFPKVAQRTGAFRVVLDS